MLETQIQKLFKDKEKTEPVKKPGKTSADVHVVR